MPRLWNLEIPEGDRAVAREGGPSHFTDHEAQYNLDFSVGK